MAITWGTEIKSGSGNGLRLGYEFSQSPATVGTSTSSAVVTLKVYVWTRYSVSDSSNAVTITGDFAWSGGANISHGGSGGTTLVRTITRTVATSLAASVKSSFAGTISGVNAVPGTAKVTGSFTTAKRPAAPPAAITNVVAARVSDARQTITWTRNVAAAAPYESIEVARWDSTSNTWRTIATVTGTATAYTDSSTGPNARYRYRVRPKNTGGTADFTYSNHLTTTQATPTGITATKSGGGIVLTWTNRGTAQSGVEVWHAANGAWDAAPLVTLTGTPTTWTHAAPATSATHTYRLRARSSEPTLYSAYSTTSNTVSVLGPPNAPTRLTPGSGAFDATDATVFSWRHNATDTTAQSAYELQYRVGAGAWTGTGKVASGGSSRSFPADTFTNGQVIEWQVRTWGEHATASAWAPSAVVKLSARPSGTITTPGPLALGSRVSVAWLYYDDEGTDQSAFKIRLEDANGAQLWGTTRNTSETSFTIPAALADGSAYTVVLSVRDAEGVWSYESSQAFTVDFADPAAPVITALWDLDMGAVTIQVEHPAPGPDEVPAVSAEVWRSTDGGDWALLAKDLDPDTTVADFIPALDTVSYYRVVSASATPSYRESLPIEVLTPSKGWIFVNSGPGFGRVVKIRDNADTSYSLSRQKALNTFAGREHPVETVGEGRELSISLSASIGGGSSTLDEWENLAFLPAPLCYRDGTRREFVSVDSTGSSYKRIFKDVNVSFKKVDFNE